MNASECYWKERLSGELAALDLPTDRPRPPILSAQGASVSRELPSALVHAFETLSRHHGVTLSAAMLSAYIALLHRMTGQSEILVGARTRRAGPRSLGSDRATGHFADPLVVRVRLTGEPSFLDLAAQVAAEIASAEAHSGPSLGALLALVQPPADPSRHPVFQAMFEIDQDPSGHGITTTMLTPSAPRSECGPIAVELSLVVRPSPQGIQVTLLYSVALFGPDSMERMLDHLALLIAGVVACPTRAVAEIALLSPAERRRVLVEWNETQTAYPRNTCIHQLFEAQVERTPDAIAATFEGEELTYRELDIRANRLAHRLIAGGVGPNQPVGIFVERSLEMLVGLLGILKAGGAYVPLDPRYPAERLRLMLTETRAQVLLGRREDAERLAFRGEVVGCDQGSDAADAERPPVSGVRATDLAYVMFTSGSTGQPKGVAVPHRGVVRLVVQTNYVAFGPRDRVTHASSLSFDASTFEIWGSLIHGARVVVVPHETLLSSGAFSAMVRREGVTLMFLSAALFHALAGSIPEVFHGLSSLIIGGDALDPNLSRAVLEKGPPGRLVNGYGPTESTTFATAHVVRDVPAGAARIPIGRPISNTRVYVLDRGLAPVPVGVAGELYIAGDGLARGYLNRPELTAERFIESPLPEEPGPTLYKTGDRVRYLPDGTLEFLGRLDAQVKIRGFRIEIGEIEAVLTSCSAVRDAAVVVQEDAPGHKRLVAHVVVGAGQDPPPAHNERGADAAEPRAADGMPLLDFPARLRRALKEKLPDYMIPSTFILRCSLPLTPNGKVDRGALRAPRGDTRDHEVPRSADATLAACVARAWSRVLNVGSMDPHEDFFALGGDSVLAVQLLIHLQAELGIELPIGLLFRSPTVAGLARSIEEARGERKNVSTLAVARDLRAEAALDPEIRPEGAPAEEGAPQRSIFLTGATGFLGAFLLRELVEETQATVHCLVRAGDAAEGLARIRRNLETYALWDRSVAGRIIAVPGDLAMPLLGLTRERFEALAERLDALYHAGAEISYVKSYASHRAVNVLGTQEILRLACRRRTKRLHYLSTVAVFGNIGYFKDVRTVGEGDDLDVCADCLHTDTGYSQSKWVAEKLVWIARSRGAQVTVFRPGFIMGHSRRGVTNTNDFVSRLIKGCVEMGYFPYLPDQSKEFVPVDFVSKAIVRLSRREGALGKAFHLVPGPAQRVDLMSFFELIRAFGYPLKKLPYPRWRDVLLSRIQRASDNALLPLAPMLTERVHGSGRTRWEMYEKMPGYERQNTLDGLEGTAIACPRMNAELLDIYLSYYIRSGFLPPPAARGTPPSAPVSRCFPTDVRRRLPRLTHAFSR